MQTREQCMANHPSSQTAVRGSEESTSPFRAFFDAITELELVVATYGTASLEASEARAHVRKFREVAAAEWRARRNAA